jgi:hypothetical protein
MTFPELEKGISCQLKAVTQYGSCQALQKLSASRERTVILFGRRTVSSRFR